MHEDDDDHDKDDTFGSGVNTHDGGLEGLGGFPQETKYGCPSAIFWRCVFRIVSSLFFLWG